MAVSMVRDDKDENGGRAWEAHGIGAAKLILVHAHVAEVELACPRAMQRCWSCVMMAGPSDQRQCKRGRTQWQGQAVIGCRQRVYWKLAKEGGGSWRM